MSPALRDAYNALDQARTRAWRRWREDFHRCQDADMPFNDAFEHAWQVLADELRPYWSAVSEA